MSVVNSFFKTYCRRLYARIERMRTHAIEDQHTIFNTLLARGAQTIFGRIHNLDKITDIKSFQSALPVADYESFRPYIKRIFNGEKNILWKGLPIYFAKTSGTTSGAKYIPITHDSITHHIHTARAAMITYAFEKDLYDWLRGNMIFLSGSPKLVKSDMVRTGRLSGIVHHHVPFYFRTRRLPSSRTNKIEDWEEKLTAIVRETAGKNITLVSGITPWIKMYFEYLLAYTNKANIAEIFPHLQLIVHGGVNMRPYEALLDKLLGAPIDKLETFPASEGFFAFQDTRNEKGLLLNTNAGIFYEFIRADEIGKAGARRYVLEEVTLGVVYAMVISTNAGLWAYDLGDTIRFVNLAPYRIEVMGRVHHYTSAFGEHVIAQEVESAMREVADKIGAQVVEFTIAPDISEEKGRSRHEWWVELENKIDIEKMEKMLDDAMRKRNIYYDDLVRGSILAPLSIRLVRKNAFRDYMREEGRLGGQNKLARLSNDRKIVEALRAFLME